MKDFDLYCVKCNRTLSINADPQKQYCDKCWRIHKREYNNNLYRKQAYSKKLKEFYSFLRIPLITSPYMNGKRLERLVVS